MGPISVTTDKICQKVPVVQSCVQQTGCYTFLSVSHCCTSLQHRLWYLLLLLRCVPQCVQVSVGGQLRLHGADPLLQAAQLTCDLPLQLLHLLQVLLQALGLWVEVKSGTEGQFDT